MIPLVRPEFPNWDEVRMHLASGKMSNFGPCYWKLVERLSDLTDRYDVPCGTGTAAIQLALQSTLPRGSRVLIPDFTHIGTLQAVVAAGMVPILSDISKITWKLNLWALPCKEFDAMVVVSPFGYSVAFDSFDNWAKANDKKVIYDLAGAFGVVVKTKNPVCYSMHATKNIPVGEGGFVSFADPDEADRAFKLSCFDQNKDRSIASPYGGNFKLDEIRCAVALVQLESIVKIQNRIRRKKDLISRYQNALAGHCDPHGLHLGNSAPSLCVLSGLPAKKLEAKSAEMGFEVKQYYPLLTRMDGLKSIARIRESSPYMTTCLALPSDVTDDEADMIAERIKQEV